MIYLMSYNPIFEDKIVSAIDFCDFINDSFYAFKGTILISSYNDLVDCSRTLHNVLGRCEFMLTPINQFSSDGWINMDIWNWIINKENILPYNTSTPDLKR